MPKNCVGLIWIELKIWIRSCVDNSILGPLASQDILYTYNEEEEIILTKYIYFSRLVVCTSFMHWVLCIVQSGNFDSNY